MHVPEVLLETTLPCVSFGREELVHSGVQGKDGHRIEHRPAQFLRQDGLLCASSSLLPASCYREEPDLRLPSFGETRCSVVVEDYALGVGELLARGDLVAAVPEGKWGLRLGILGSWPLPTDSKVPLYTELII